METYWVEYNISDGDNIYLMLEFSLLNHLDRISYREQWYVIFYRGSLFLCKTPVKQKVSEVVGHLRLLKMVYQINYL